MIKRMKSYLPIILGICNWIAIITFIKYLDNREMNNMEIVMDTYRRSSFIIPIISIFLLRTFKKQCLIKENIYILGCFINGLYLVVYVLWILLLVYLSFNITA